ISTMTAMSAIFLIQPRRPGCFFSISALPDLGRSADGDLVHPQRRLTDTDRHSLAVLAAGADTRIESKIVADHCDAMKVSRTVADQHGTFDGRTDLAVFNLVGLGALEHVFSGGDVDLSAAKADSEKPVLDRADDFLRIVLPCEHVGVGHP